MALLPGLTLRGQRYEVHAVIQTAESGFGSGDGPEVDHSPWALMVQFLAGVSKDGQQYEPTSWQYDALLTWRHVDGSGRGYKSEWVRFSNQEWFADNYLVTQRQFYDQPGTQFMAQILLRNVVVEGEAVADLDTKEKGPFTIPPNRDILGGITAHPVVTLRQRSLGQMRAGYAWPGVRALAAGLTGHA